MNELLLTAANRSDWINMVGMVALACWAAVNIVVGIVGWRSGNAWTRYFFRMGLFWNLVNITIAIWALAHLPNDTLVNTVDELKSRSNELLYLVNAGLDIIYAGGGVVLVWRSLRAESSRNLLQGFGIAIVFQAIFLLIFDLTLFLLQYGIRAELVYG